MNNQTDYYPALYRLWSVIALGAGSAALYEAMAMFDDPTELFKSLSEPRSLPPELRCRLSPQLKNAGKIPLTKAEEVYEECGRNGISVIPIDSDIYPRRLLRLYHPPAVLFVKGDIGGIDNRLSLSVVGARRASEYSIKVTSAIVRTLAGHNFDIVSGFAEGIDICAHLSAVNSGTRTFAVLGTGVDVDYPKANNKYRRLIEENGAFISEYLPGTRGHSVNFPQRNRILVALSLGTAVIEASAKSGSLNSASHGADQGKPVFVVPPADLFDSRYCGNSELIRQGAVPLMGARDIYNEYCLLLSHTIDENEALRREMERMKSECDPDGGIKQTVYNHVQRTPDGAQIRRAAAAAKRLDREARAKKSGNGSKGNNGGGGSKRNGFGSANESGAPVDTADHGSSESSVNSGTRENTHNVRLSEKSQPGEQRFAVPEELTEGQARVMNVICKTGRPVRADEIAAATGIDIEDILEIITDLEIMGIIRSEGSNYMPAEK